MFNFLKTLLIVSLISCALLSGSLLAAEPVDINTASSQELALNLTGIGSNKAQAIVTYREQNGHFQHIDELVNVKGIGLNTIEKNRSLILLSDDSQQ